MVNPIADMAVHEDAPDIVIDLRAVFHDAETAGADLVYAVQSSDPTLISATIDNTTEAPEATRAL